ncbi:GNAT family N-acetyltransferase [Deinococcus petrolearius]|uniref:GNAT family N-acetyltransferase n=1 Tax=Deinococcus petrolearius TaxID=1751295 RepID=A0ABW1DJV4_9DEIO
MRSGPRLSFRRRGWTCVGTNPATSTTAWPSGAIRGSSRYTSGRALDREAVWARLLRHPRHWALLGFGYWVVVERVTGRFVGEVGVARFERETPGLLPELGLLPEAGWVLRPWAHGQGYAREAVEAVLAWRDVHLPVQGTFCLIHPDNTPSLRLARRMGFVPVSEVGEPNHPLTLLRR